ncbi:MAG: DUF2345 domain-containing protein, partial [Collimonas pratensis]|uniref:DUF2345 domain-containing protein n=1 Tax=Collimonas pratensis TaxID=279113 RepID=UPI003C70FF16
AQILKAQNDAIKGQGTGEEGSFPELSQPHLVLASPAGIETTTSGSTHIASDQSTAITTGKSLSIASGDSLFASIRQTFRLFVYKAGMKLIAAAGDIDMKALSDSINLLAKLNITQTANRITIAATEEILINGGGSYAKLNASGIEHGTNGTYLAHAATHAFPGPKNMDTVKQAEFEKSIPQKYSQQLYVDEALWNLPSGIKAVQYKFISQTNNILGAGKIDALGKSKPLFTESGEPASIEIDVNDGKWTHLITERHESLSVPDSSEMIVFDYPEHSDKSAEADDSDDQAETGKA